MASAKYKSTRTVGADGITHASIAEHARWEQLKIMLRAGIISCLERQVPFILAPSVIINGRKRPPLKYVADFVYVVTETGARVIEDVKGFETEGYRIKRHLMAANGDRIIEIRRKSTRTTK